MGSRNAITGFARSDSRRRVGPRLPALASLATLVVCAGVQAQQNEDKVAAERRALMAEQMLRLQHQLDAMVFQPDRTASAARQRLDALLASKVQDIDRVCHLTDAQRKKLQLAGRGDICRFFERYEGVKLKPQLLEPDEHGVLAIQREVQSLRMTLQSGLFHEESLLHKSLRNTLTGEQFARHNAVDRERRVARHRVSIEAAVKILQRGVSLREAQRRELLTLMTKEIRPSRREGPYDQYRILIQAGRLPEGKLKPLFDNAQWQAVTAQLAQLQALEPRLRESGMLPAEDDEDDSADAAPPNPKK
jgi:hypothetical protein